MKRFCIHATANTTIELEILTIFTKCVKIMINKFCSSFINDLLRFILNL